MSVWDYLTGGTLPADRAFARLQIDRIERKRRTGAILSHVVTASRNSAMPCEDDFNPILKDLWNATLKRFGL